MQTSRSLRTELCGLPAFKGWDDEGSSKGEGTASEEGGKPEDMVSLEPSEETVSQRGSDRLCQKLSVNVK